MSQEDFPHSEPEPSQPSLEAQRALLMDINARNSEELLNAGVLAKAQAVRMKQVEDTGRPMFAHIPPEAFDVSIDRNAQRGVAEVSRILDPSQWTVNHQVNPSMTEFYSVTFGTFFNILVGWSEIDDDGYRVIVPNEGFTEEDVQLIKKMTAELIERRASGELPDLTPDLQRIYNPGEEHRAE